MSSTPKLRPGTRVSVPWGLDVPRLGTVIEVWGDPPTQIRVELLPLDEDAEPAVLLLDPKLVTAA